MEVNFWGKSCCLSATWDAMQKEWTVTCRKRARVNQKACCFLRPEVVQLFFFLFLQKNNSFLGKTMFMVRGHHMLRK